MERREIPLYNKVDGSSTCSKLGELIARHKKQNDVNEGEFSAPSRALPSAPPAAPPNPTNDQTTTPLLAESILATVERRQKPLYRNFEGSTNELSELSSKHTQDDDMGEVSAPSRAFSSAAPAAQVNATLGQTTIPLTQNWAPCGAERGSERSLT